MASRRMRLKGVANISALRSGGPARPLTPSPSPGPFEQNSSGSIFPCSPHSPVKHYHPMASPRSGDERSRHASSSPRRPEPTPSPTSYSHNSPWSPALVNSSHSTPMSPVPINSSHSQHSQSSSEPPYSPYFQPIQPESPLPQTNTGVQRGGPDEMANPQDGALIQQSEEQRNFFSFSESVQPPTSFSSNIMGQHGIDTVMTNLQKEIGLANVTNLNSPETLRQRLQKGTSLSTSKYATVRKEFLTQYPRVEKPPDKNKLTILHFTFWNPSKKDGEGNQETTINEDSNVDGLKFHSSQLEDMSNKSRETEKNSQSDTVESSEIDSKQHRRSVPRVKVGPNGEIIIDEQSLVIETSDSKRAKKQLAEMETVSGADYEVGSSGIYRHKKNSSRGRDWTSKETIKFYRALSTCGTDFSMMCQFFQQRSRAELKAKFKREDRKNHVQINEALCCQVFNPEDWVSSGEEDETKVQTCAPKIYRKNSNASSPNSQMADSVKTKSSPAVHPWQTLPDDNLLHHKKKASHKRKSVFDEVEKIPLVTTPIPLLGGGKPKSLQKGRPRQLINETTYVANTTESPSSKLLELVERVNKLQSRIKEKNIEVSPIESKKPKIVRKRKPLAKNKGVDEPDIRPDILRFDPGDPLGYKILARSATATVAQTSGTVLLDAPNYESIPHQVFELSNVHDGTTECRDSNSEEYSNSRKKMVQSKAKLTSSYRVPGPGTLPSKSPSMVDEIEIEISCL